MPTLTTGPANQNIYLCYRRWHFCDSSAYCCFGDTNDCVTIKLTSGVSNTTISTVAIRRPVQRLVTQRLLRFRSALENRLFWRFERRKDIFGNLVHKLVAPEWIAYVVVNHTYVL